MIKPQRIDRLRFEGVSFQFSGHDPIFQNVDFDFPTDQLIWVKAEHGQGRSTLLQLLAALQSPTRGSYQINGENVTDMSFEEFLPYRLSIGYGFDLGGLIHNRSMLDNLILPLVYHKVLDYFDAHERALSYIKKFKIEKYKDQRPSFVPGGTRKLVCMIRALILNPQVLLLDDPSVGLSQEIALEYFDLVQQLRQAGHVRHVFVSSYDEQLMGTLDHKEIFIEGGLLHQLPQFEDKKVVAL